MSKCGDCKYWNVHNDFYYPCKRLSQEMEKEDGTIYVSGCVGSHAISVSRNFGCIYFEIGV